MNDSEAHGWHSLLLYSKARDTIVCINLPLIIIITGDNHFSLVLNTCGLVCMDMKYIVVVFLKTHEILMKEF